MTSTIAPTTSPDAAIAPTVIMVPMGRGAVAAAHEQLRTVGLGSCVAIILFAPDAHLVALAHCMLPIREDPYDAPHKYADAAVPALLAQLAAAGAHAPFSATLVGGASMFPGVPTAFMRDIPGQNIAAARAALAAAAIPIRQEDVGGNDGRSVLVDPVTQRVLVRSLRGGDRWL
jgi:chemotaxis protein CheD